METVPRRMVERSLLLAGRELIHEQVASSYATARLIKNDIWLAVLRALEQLSAPEQERLLLNRASVSFQEGARALGLQANAEAYRSDVEYLKPFMLAGAQQLPLAQARRLPKRWRSELKRKLSEILGRPNEDLKAWAHRLPLGACSLHSIIDTSDRMYLVKVFQTVSRAGDRVALNVSPEYTGLFGFPSVTLWDHRTSFEELSRNLVRVQSELVHAIREHWSERG